MSVAELDGKAFSQAINSAQPVIVDFWADWCMPCKMMAPVFDELSNEYKGKLSFAKIHTVDYPEYAERCKVEGIPCLVMFKSGKEVGRLVGFMPKQALKQQIDRILK